MSFLLGIIYLSFISLGLPDALLGAAWPNMYPEFQIPASYAGMISMIIALGTIISSLQSDRLTRKFGTGKVTAVSVGITALALWGFSISHSFILLCLWAIPYGLGAGSVDASLNNYVALHYASKHMSWLHCMWGIGATLGPYIMGAVLSGGATWNTGYRIISVLQIVLTAVLIFSLPKWKKQNTLSEKNTSEKVLSLKEILAIPGAKAIMVCFFCYCAVEQTTMLWASSYLNLAKGVDAKTAASFAGMFCIGITIGRGINGFIAMKLKDRQMIRMGQAIILTGIIIMILPFGQAVSLIGKPYRISCYTKKLRTAPVSHSAFRRYFLSIFLSILRQSASSSFPLFSFPGGTFFQRKSVCFSRFRHRCQNSLSWHLRKLFLRKSSFSAEMLFRK